MIDVETVTDASSLPAVMAQLHAQLRSYIEAQYPIRHADVVAERRALLDSPGMLEQEPYIEGMPAYESGRPYGELSLPQPVVAGFKTFAGWTPPLIPEQPYAHQCAALEALVGRDQDLVVVTGTGSGKTETFLLPILARSLLEAAQRPQSFAQPGMRVLLLYPMNALVNDQLTRLRRLFGDPRLAGWLHQTYGSACPLRFGMYTSRTPYAGQMDAERNQQRLLPLLDEFLRIEREQPDQAQTLRQLGRWPALDVQALRAAALRGEVSVGREDYELYTRHQIQRWCPDILVTNYSMLEYMLMRPIERTVFEQTAQWLAHDDANTLLVVLDEAHLYSGVTGTEIGLLLRRLHARLGIDRQRVRYVVTSASLDPGDDTSSAKQVEDFVSGLVGARQGFATSFAIIRGRRRDAPTGATSQVSTRHATGEAEALATFDQSAFFRRAADPHAASDAVVALADTLHWPHPARPDAISSYLAEQLPSLEVFRRLWQTTSGGAIAFSRLAQHLFPFAAEHTRSQATSALLTLCAAATTGDGRALLPARAHLFFRGLPPVYACVNPYCSARRVHGGDIPGQGQLGTLWVTPRLRCTCGGRVYELYSHRSCGAIFLRAFAPSEPADFYWHEAGDVPRDRSDDDISQTQLLVGEPHPKSREDVEVVYLHVPTGRVLSRASTGDAVLRVARPAKEKVGRNGRSGLNEGQADADEDEDEGTPRESRRWRSCPVCRKRLDTPISSLATKGEQPFVNLVRRQFELQPASAAPTDAAPNMGRKVLLFSDGRQRAARLARDLPREVELDTFRQALLLAVARRGKRTGASLVRMDHALYRDFVGVCAQHRLHFFDGPSQEQLARDIRDLDEIYGGDVALAESDGWERTPPEAYRAALLRQVADRLYSMQRMCVAVVEPLPVTLKLLKRHEPFSRLAEEDLRAYSTAWIDALLMRSAFDSQIAWSDRQNVVPGEALPLAGHAGAQEKWTDAERAAKELLGFSEADLRFARQHLVDELCDLKEQVAYLRPEKLALCLTLDESWYRCTECEQTVWSPLRGRCPNPRCGGSRLVLLPGNDPSLRARTAFYREPVRATVAGNHQPMHMMAEEHTAQLSHRDLQEVSATTERYELRFQDVGITLERPAIDVLSCTTTMEVGIDIGALLGVGLRTVPPRRANYQQRAGRAGRRGSTLATVLTYSENGTHDGHYFAHPDELIAAPVPCPQLSPINDRLLHRHIQAALLQTYFLGHVPATQPMTISARQYGYLSEALGTATAFFAPDGPTTLAAFEQWLVQELQDVGSDLAARTIAWLSDAVNGEFLQAEERVALVRQVGSAFVSALRAVGERYAPQVATSARAPTDALRSPSADSKLLDVLFDEGFLPTYAFPREVRSFVIEEWKHGPQRTTRIGIRQRPQQSADVALSEYAPGRELIVDKATYRVSGIYVDPLPGATLEMRVPSLFQHPRPVFLLCPRCGHIRKEEPAEREEGGRGSRSCPLCGAPMRRDEVLDPPGFASLGAKPLEERQIRNDGTRRSGVVTQVKLVVPMTEADVFSDMLAGGHVAWSTAQHRELLITNQGPRGEGFSVCKSCGAAAPGTALWLSQAHDRPFLVPPWLPAPRRCTGKEGIWHGALGHIFHSDLLLLRLRWWKGLAYEVGASWMQDACETLAQAMVRAATRMLDVSSAEVRAGWSYTQSSHSRPDTHNSPEPAGPHMVDFYLFDTLSGGAGYATQIGTRVPELLQRMQEALDECPDGCERSCYRCLRSYENRVVHDHLDRRLGGMLLHAILSGELPQPADADTQAAQLAPLADFLELAGVQTQTNVSWSGITVPLEVQSLRGRIAVGVRSVLSDYGHVLHPLDRLPKPSRLVCTDYQLTRDLPGIAAVLGT